MELSEAQILAMKTDYAIDACEPEGNEINSADAGAFFLEGYKHCIKDINKALSRG
jgi:hypothetical protein